LTAMMSTVNGSPESWIPVLALTASILLFADGVNLCFSRIHGRWLIVVVTVIPPVLCSIFGEWPLRCWLFSAALAIIEASFLWVAALSRREGVAAFASCLILVSTLAESIVRLFLQYWAGWWSAESRWTLTDIVGFMLPALIPWSILVGILIHAAKVALAKNQHSNPSQNTG
jgi:hypothetical protein